MDNIEIMVEFMKYCETCKHNKLPEHYDPCNDCLDSPVNMNSMKPVYYEEDPEKIKTE